MYNNLYAVTFAQKLFTYPKERSMSIWKQHIANVKVCVCVCVCQLAGRVS